MKMAIEQPEYKRAVQIIVYDLQGGPFPETAITKLVSVAEQVAEAHKGLAISIVEV